MLEASVQESLAPSDTSADRLLAAALAQAAARQLPVAGLIDYATQLAAVRRSMAATLYKTWIAFNADHPGLHAIYFNYAVCLADSDDIAGAVNALRETIRLKPDFGPPHINLGSLLERSGQPGQAVETWLSLVTNLAAVTPEAVSYKLLALKQTGRVLEAANKDDAAEDALRQSLEFDPGQQDAIQHWIALRQRQCKWPALTGSERMPVGKLRAAMSPLSAAYCADDPLFQLATAYTYARRNVGLPPKGRARLEAIPTADTTRRLRIGYVSSDLRDHAVGFAMTDVFELHDRSKVEVFAYYCGIAASDDTQQRSIRAVEHWQDLTGLDDNEAAQLIRHDGIDILIDLNGYTKDARTKVFAMRPAPVAVNWFGFPGSMGSPYHHYLVADHHVIPPDHERYYSEKVLRIPCYQPNDRKRVIVATPPSRSEAGLPETGFVFCCLNGLQKLTSSCFQDWMTILGQVPDSVLWLLSGPPETNERLRVAAQQYGVAGTRLIFADKRRNPEHLARMALADLFLDTFPYGAHTTASDALWMGLPVLTLQGRSFASRVCGSLVSAAGTPEMICHTREEYVARAVELADDGQKLAAIRQNLRAGRETCTLFDTPKLVRSLETLYEQMHEARLAGTTPQPDLTNLDVYHELAAAEDVEVVGELDTETYLSHYHKRIADLDGIFPVHPDRRIWQRQFS